MSKLFQFILSSCFLLNIHINAVSYRTEDESVKMLQQHLCRKNCNKKVSENIYFVDAIRLNRFFSGFFLFRFRIFFFSSFKCVDVVLIILRAYMFPLRSYNS